MFVFQNQLQTLKLDLLMPSTAGADAKSVPIQIDAHGYTGSVTLKVYNMLAKAVVVSSYDLSSATARLSVDLSPLASGKYLLVAEVNGQRVGACQFIRDRTSPTTFKLEGSPLVVQPSLASSKFFKVNSENSASVQILPAALGFSKATLYNLLGKAVYSQPISNSLPSEGLTLDFSTIKTDFGEIPNGVYVLVLSNSSNPDLRAAQKVVISR